MTVHKTVTIERPTHAGGLAFYRPSLKYAIEGQSPWYATHDAWPVFRGPFPMVFTVVEADYYYEIEGWSDEGLIR